VARLGRQQRTDVGADGRHHHRTAAESASLSFDVAPPRTTPAIDTDRTRGDHAILKYTHPGTGAKRTVTVPLHDRVRIGTLQSITRQYGANDCHEWCRWIDEHR
jgi:predicted RNA binding protein YcfA (HicA-like mRNA interferase family)